MLDKTVEYYNENAQEFFDTTVAADMSQLLDEFIKLLPEGGAVLDAGCGSGRDSLGLKRRGFKVVAFDASEEMCKRASELLGQMVRQCRFEELDYVDQFDGIWACASLLHVTREAMPDVINRLSIALKTNGVLYASFKYGTGECYRGARRFTDADDAYLREILKESFEIIEISESKDVRPEKVDEVWINVFARKKSR